ncbi:hypothetical protein V8D89_001185 [Ganoderma adspersum]
MSLCSSSHAPPSYHFVTPAYDAHIPPRTLRLRHALSYKGGIFSGVNPQGTPKTRLLVTPRNYASIGLQPRPKPFGRAHHHTRAVARGSKAPFLIADMLFWTYPAGPEDALRSCVALCPSCALRAAPRLSRWRAPKASLFLRQENLPLAYIDSVSPKGEPRRPPLDPFAAAPLNAQKLSTVPRFQLPGTRLSMKETGSI